MIELIEPLLLINPIRFMLSREYRSETIKTKGK